MTTVRQYLSALGLFSATLLAPLAAHAATAECMNDIDCKASSQCGGDVCSWAALPQKCVPAGTAPKGQDGWCTVDSDCKCMGEGAKCAAPYCTFTTPPGAGGASSGGASSGGSSAGGAAAGGSAGAATAGATAAAPASDSGGCSIVGATSPRGGFAFALGAVCAAALVSARRRRRA